MQVIDDVPVSFQTPRPFTRTAEWSCGLVFPWSRVFTDRTSLVWNGVGPTFTAPFFRSTACEYMHMRNRPRFRRCRRGRHYGAD